MQPKPENQETTTWKHHPHWEYEDPFAEPRTIPTGWDMSEFLKPADGEPSPNAVDVKDGLNH